MTLDRLTHPDKPAFDSRHHCDRCGDHVPVLIRLCTYCATPPQTTKEHTMSDQPDPRFPNIPPEQIGDTLLLPEYCVEVAELLAATENHIDPTVRAIRKIVTQAAVALRTAHQASGLGETPPSESDTHARSQAERLETLGVNASVVRAWATTQGIEVAAGGRLRNEVLTAYEQAHPVAA